MVFNQPRTTTVRFERNDSTERFPMGYYTVEIADDEFDVMIDTDYQQRRAAAEDPESVQRRSPEVIIDDLVGRVEYNQAKSHHRNTTFRASTPRDESQPISVVKSELSADGYLAGSATLADPADAWVGELTVWDAINLLSERERTVLVAVKLDGFTQSEVANQLNVSQPMVAKILKHATTKLEAMLR